MNNNPKGRDTDLIELRNKALIKRFYFWYHIKRVRYDDVLEKLRTEEFFISDRRIEDILKDNADTLEKIESQKPTLKELVKLEL